MSVSHALLYAQLCMIPRVASLHHAAAVPPLRFLVIKLCKYVSASVCLAGLVQPCSARPGQHQADN